MPGIAGMPGIVGMPGIAGMPGAGVGVFGRLPVGSFGSSPAIGPPDRKALPYHPPPDLGAAISARYGGPLHVRRSTEPRDPHEDRRDPGPGQLGRAHADRSPQGRRRCLPHQLQPRRSREHPPAGRPGPPRGDALEQADRHPARSAGPEGQNGQGPRAAAAVGRRDADHRDGRGLHRPRSPRRHDLPADGGRRGGGRAGPVRRRRAGGPRQRRAAGYGRGPRRGRRGDRRRRRPRVAQGDQPADRRHVDPVPDRQGPGRSGRRRRGRRRLRRPVLRPAPRRRDPGQARAGPRGPRTASP